MGVRGVECREIDVACGEGYVRRVSGSVMTERFTGAQIRKFMKDEPRAWGATGAGSFGEFVFCVV